MKKFIEVMKSIKEAAGPVLFSKFDIRLYGLDVVIVRGVSLSSILLALGGACVILGVTIHFQNGFLYMLSDALPHTDRPMPSWLFYGQRF